MRTQSSASALGAENPPVDEGPEFDVSAAEVRETIPSMCIVSGDGLTTAMARQKASFSITARDATGNQQRSGGDNFKVAVRGSSLASAKVIDQANGEYWVEYKPSTSGSYSISVSLNGVSLPGSPFRLEVLTPAPDPAKCALVGEALTRARAREVASFEVQFVDALGQIARAEELDVWVEAATLTPNDDAPIAAPIAAPASDSFKKSSSFKKPPSLDRDSEGAEAPPATADLPDTLADDDQTCRNSLSTAAMTNRQLMTTDALARTGSKVEVGAKPLIMRATSSLDSPLVTVLRPGQLIRVVEEMELGDGKLRAKVEQVEEEAAARAIADSWWQPPNVSTGMEPMWDSIMTSRVSEASARGSLTSPTASVTGSATGRFPVIDAMSPWWSHTGLFSPDLDQGSVAGSATGSAMGTARSGRKTKRRPLRGWVTFVKKGAELVAPRPRLDAGERRKHMELWARREAADKSLKKTIDVANSKGGEKETKKYHAETSIGPGRAHEITDDPQGIAFAYGGINPGTVHAGGKLVRNHQVRYSIGKSGTYKLHVGLRSQAIPLPGSPFDLYVAPSNAHALSTSLVDSLPLRGVVGEDWSCTCTLHVVDRMGNRCVTGGAGIVVDIEHGGDKMHAKVDDNDDGSYKLSWRGTVSGTYTTRIRIDGVHVHGSPTPIKMFSGPPDVPKCEITGAGLKTALAGQAASVSIICKDRFSNSLSSESLQGQELKFGLALLQATDNKALKDTVPSMPFESNWVKSSEGGEHFEIQYTAKNAGDFDLHVWCDPEGSGHRQWLTGSPFTIRVSGVRPSHEGSTVERLGDYELVAGESILLRPQLRDEFGNASSAVEGSFEVNIEAPDGTQPLELKPLKGLGLYEVGYDVTIKGKHLVHFLLNGQDISGSPVDFSVLPGAAVGNKSKLHPPQDTPSIGQQCELFVEAIDKYGNKLDKGGSKVDARASGPGVSQATHEDHDNGTYTIMFTAAVVGETRVTVRLDNMEMAPIKVVFVDNDKGKAKGKAVEAAREEVDVEIEEIPAAAPSTDEIEAPATRAQSEGPKQRRRQSAV